MFAISKNRIIALFVSAALTIPGMVMNKAILKKQTIFFVLICFFFITPVTADLPEKIEQDKYMAILLDALKNKNYEKALPYFEKLESIKLPLPDAFFFYKGDAMAKTNHPFLSEEAINQYLKAAGTKGKYYRQALAVLVEIEPVLQSERKRMGEEYYQRGIAKIKKGDFEGSIEDFNKAIELDPKHHYAYASRGQAYRQNGNFNESINDLNHAIKLYPQFGWAYAQRGETYRMKRDYEKAIDDFDRGLKFANKLNWIFVNRALAFKENGEFKNSINSWTNLLGREPSNAFALNSRSWIFIINSEYEKAIIDAERALELSSETGYHDTLGWALFHKGNLRKAKIQAKKVLSLNPNHIFSNLLLYRIESTRGDKREAIKKIRKLFDIYQNKSGTDVDLLRYFLNEIPIDKLHESRRWHDYQVAIRGYSEQGLD